QDHGDGAALPADDRIGVRMAADRDRSALVVREEPPELLQRDRAPLACHELLGPALAREGLAVDLRTVPVIHASQVRVEAVVGEDERSPHCNFCRIAKEFCKRTKDCATLEVMTTSK